MAMQNSEKQNSIVIFVPTTERRDKFKNIFFIPGKNQFSFCSPNLTSPYVIKRETTAKKKKKLSGYLHLFTSRFTGAITVCCCLVGYLVIGAYSLIVNRNLILI